MSAQSLLIAPDPEQLSLELRKFDNPLLRQRRKVIRLTLFSSACMAVIAAYQIGLTRRVPEPRLPWLDADKVDASAEAYEKLSTGDAFLGFVSYGVTMLLAAIGGSRRHEAHPYHRAFCSWCLAAAASTFAVLPAVLPEARAALRVLRSGRGIRPAPAQP